jgi:hypothetical protein
MSNIPVDKLTSVYLKIKARRSELAAQFKEEDSALVEKQERIRKALLNYCKDNNVDSVKTPNGTFYRSAKTKYWTSDWEEMHKFILEYQVPELLSKQINQSNMKQFLEENPDALPKGLNVDSEYTISVRKA